MSSLKNQLRDTAILALTGAIFTKIGRELTSDTNRFGRGLTSAGNGAGDALASLGDKAKNLWKEMIK